ncbi:MAG: hypothetical protein ACYDCK_12040, partial [Thermoplasmatota archaeon]
MHVSRPRFTFLAIFLAASAATVATFLWAPRWFLYAAFAPIAVLAAGVALALPHEVRAPREKRAATPSADEAALELVSVVPAAPRPRVDASHAVEVPASSARAPAPRDERAVPQVGYYPQGLPASTPFRAPS